MNDELRKRIIKAVQSDKSIKGHEHETNIYFSKVDDYARVCSSAVSLMRRLIAHGEFETEYIVQRSPDDGYIQIYADELDDEFDGRRPVVEVVGTVPVATLKIAKNARTRDQQSLIISSAALEVDVGGD